MAARLPARYASRDAAARKIAAMLRYKIAAGYAYETYTEFADAIGLPDDGNIPNDLRVRIEDYLMPPLEPDREVHATHSYYKEDS